MTGDDEGQAVDVQLGAFSRMLILDGQHEGHVADRFDDTWVCSCGGLVSCGA